MSGLERNGWKNNTDQPEKQRNIENSRCSPKVVWFPFASVRMFPPACLIILVCENIVTVIDGWSFDDMAHS